MFKTEYTRIYTNIKHTHTQMDTDTQEHTYFGGVFACTYNF